MARKKKTPRKSPPMSQAAYAQRRKALGLQGNRRAIQKQIKSGTLEPAIVMVGGVAKIADPDLADRLWAENTRGPAADDQAIDASEDGMSFNEARRRKEIELWRQVKVKREHDELELAAKRGEYVRVDEARDVMTNAYNKVKNKMLSLPARIKQRIPRVTAADVGLIKNLVREALEELADGGKG